MPCLPQHPSVEETVIRLARPEERLRRDGLMTERHELGFLRFVGRGLRYVAVLGTLWVGMAGWQAGALKCRPRDRFIGWKAAQQYERLHLVARAIRACWCFRNRAPSRIRAAGLSAGCSAARVTTGRRPTVIRWNWRRPLWIRRSTTGRCTEPPTGRRWGSPRAMRAVGAATRIRMAS